MATYTTSFPANENPLSESGTWHFNNVAGKTPLQSTGGNCFPTDVGPGPDDSYGYLSGFGDSVISTTVFRSASLLDANANSHEIEHLHRLTDDASDTVCYEVDMPFFGGTPGVVRWFGAQGFNVLNNVVQDNAGWPDGISGQIRDAFVIKTELVAGQINIYCDSGSGFVLYFHYVLGADTVNDNPPIASGDPALGAFSPTSSGDPSTWFGFKDATITSVAGGGGGLLSIPLTLIIV